MRAVAAAVVLSLAVAATAAAPDPAHRLSLGDPARRDREVTLVLDAGVDTATGETVTAEQIAERLDAVNLLLLGESHASVESHRVQLQVLSALQRRGRAIRLALEMFPDTEQPSLEAWNEGRWSDAEFPDKAGWYEHWGYHWGYYRDILLFAREHRIKLVAANAPRELVAAVRQKGLANLSPEQAARMPPRVNTDSPDHLALFKAQLGGGDSLHGGMTEDAWKGMLAAQATWDAAMAWNAVQAFEAARDPRAIVVVLVGSGHVAFGLGIERQARAWFDGPMSSLIPMPLADDTGAATSPVRASYAHFLWGVPAERWSAWPSLGLSTRAGEGGLRQVIAVDDDGPAARAGVKVNDVLLRLDGVALDSRQTLGRQMATYDWGDVPALTIRRAGEELTLVVPLRRVE
jgi:uncharacterized iron-regulated protein